MSKTPKSKRKCYCRQKEQGPGERGRREGRRKEGKMKEGGDELILKKMCSYQTGQNLISVANSRPRMPSCPST